MQQCNQNFRISILIGKLIAAAVMASGCGGGSVSTAPNSSGGAAYDGSSMPAAVVEAQKADTAVDPAIVAADNAFGLNVLNNLIAGSTDNIAISPISLSLALHILYNGAAGTTQQAMAQTLQLGDISAQKLNSDNAALQASLTNPDPKVQLTIANSLWINLSSSPVLPSFTQMDETYYGATLGDLSGAPANVNAWVAEKTGGLIADILPPLPPPGGYKVAVIANALYFKGEWTTAFDLGQTAVAAFTLSNGAETSAEMMHQTGTYAYLQGANFQAIRIPYGQGRLNMLIVLPDPGTTMSRFVAGITNELLTNWDAEFQNSLVSIALPRFTSTYSKSLPSALTSLGMGIAFGQSADFSTLAPGAYVSDVEHKTVVEVDETGTVAAAATAVGVTTTIASPQGTMTMDHPFLYAIQDSQTGELLFIGVLMDPS
jgi:serine protease inhibitor